MKVKQKNLRDLKFMEIKIPKILLFHGEVRLARFSTRSGELDVGFLQILYLEPFAKIKKEIEGKNIILVENNATGQLGKLIAEKTGIFIEEKNKILRYDGSPQ